MSIENMQIKSEIISINSCGCYCERNLSIR